MEAGTIIIIVSVVPTEPSREPCAPGMVSVNNNQMNEQDFHKPQLGPSIEVVPQNEAIPNATGKPRVRSPGSLTCICSDPQDGHP